MKVRESGMPPEDIWNSFFNVELILRELLIDSQVKDIVEIGCGYGTFTIPVAEIIHGCLYAFDLDKEMISATQDKINNQNITNIKLIERDILSDSTKIPANSIDYVMLFNILHHEKPSELLDESFRILKNGGKVGIIHWRTDIETPRGPSLGIRTKPEDCVKWIWESKFDLLKEPLILEPYHFGIVAIKL